jgi:hypothetical protein
MLLCVHYCAYSPLRAHEVAVSSSIVDRQICTFLRGSACRAPAAISWCGCPMCTPSCGATPAASRMRTLHRCSCSAVGRKQPPPCCAHGRPAVVQRALALQRTFRLSPHINSACIVTPCRALCGRRQSTGCARRTCRPSRTTCCSTCPSSSSRSRWAPVSLQRLLHGSKFVYDIATHATCRNIVEGVAQPMCCHSHALISMRPFSCVPDPCDRRTRTWATRS